jgi:hypothetical protein
LLSRRGIPTRFGAADWVDSDPPHPQPGGPFLVGHYTDVR